MPALHKRGIFWPIHSTEPGKTNSVRHPGILRVFGRAMQEAQMHVCLKSFQYYTMREQIVKNGNNRNGELSLFICVTWLQKITRTWNWEMMSAFI